MGMAENAEELICIDVSACLRDIESQVTDRG
jgi:hypothetical protein